MSACQKLESFKLEEDKLQDGELTLHLTSSTLKSFASVEMNLESVILEAELLENLHLRESNFNDFNLVKGGAKLHALVIRVTCTRFLGFGDCPHFEEVEVKHSSAAVWVPVECILYSPSSKLRKLQLRGIPLCAEFGHPFNLERIARLFPC